MSRGTTHVVPRDTRRPLFLFCLFYVVAYCNLLYDVWSWGGGTGFAPDLVLKLSLLWILSYCKSPSVKS